MLKTMTVRATIAAILAGLSMSAHAADTARPFNVPAGDLVAALESLSKQADIELVYQAEQLRGVHTAGVNGTYEPKEAVTLLLKGTRLTIRTDDATGVMLVAPPTAPTTSSSLSLEGRGTEGEDAQRAQSPKMTELEEIVVTGTNIRGLTPDSSPLIVHDRKAIDASGAATVDQFMATIPENFAAVSPASLAVQSTGLSQVGSNAYRGASPNIHGLGPDATLTLLNGHRLAAAGQKGDLIDVSMIPLSAVERIEVLTDGASALYGADAVAGVVNIILKPDHDGQETMVRYGAATPGGAEQVTASQLFGRNWSRGGLMAVYEYDRQYGLEGRERNITRNLAPNGDLLPEMKRHSLLASGHVDLTERLTAGFDAFSNERSYFSSNLLPAVAGFNAGENRLTGGVLSLLADLSASWQGQLVVNRSRTQQHNRSFAFGSTSVARTETRLGSIELRADGPLLETLAGPIRAAVGGEFRSEDIKDTVITLSNPGVGRLDRQVKSVFAEIFWPLIGDANASHAARRLELSLAGRLDDYSDFGSTFNPKGGVLWSPVDGFNVRATYSTSYRAPFLSDLASSPLFYGIQLADPASPGGFTSALIDLSGNPDLKAQTSEAFTAGIDWEPIAVPGARFSASWFEIDFRDKVAQPPVTGDFLSLFFQTEVLGPFIDRSPDGALVQSIFNDPNFLNLTGVTPADIGAFVNLRTANISSVKESGVDLSAAYRLGLASAGELAINASATYLLDSFYSPVSGAGGISLLDKYGQPPRRRFRAGVTWTRGSLSTSVFGNHVNSYSNVLVSPLESIGAYTTFDFQASYRFGDAITAALNVLNLADAAPPRARVPANPFVADFGYDPTNASAVGRFLMLRLTAHW